MNAKTDAEDCIEDASVEKINSLACLEEIASPIVYKLVRVEGDGRLVPATDDEVMEVEDLLENDRNELPLLEGPGETEQGTSTEGFVLKQANLEGSEEDIPGESQSENIEIEARNMNARLEYIEEMLQRVKQEEKLRLSCESCVNSSKYMVAHSLSNLDDWSSSFNDELHTDHSLQETFPVFSPRFNDDPTTLSASIDTSQRVKNEPIVAGLSGPDICSCSGSKSELPVRKGEICLKNLSIRELQETFKATFGQQTSVKDKKWLKRRIAARLSNSCDIPMRVVTMEKALAHKKVEQTLQSWMECTQCNSSCPSTEQSIVAVHGSGSGMPSNPPDLTDDYQLTLSSTKLGKPEIEWSMKSGDLQMEQTAGKRIRKPTRRYIEELSEVETKECSGKVVSSVKNSVCGQSFAKSQIQPFHIFGKTGAAFVTRPDSIGGSGVQVPYALRVRRGRPRENFGALTKFQSSCMAARLVKKALGVRSSRQDADSGSRLWKARALSKRIVRPIIAESREQPLETSRIEQQQYLSLNKLDSSGYTPNDNVAVVLTSKGGIRRKHHRAWTLSEVMKLVEGVSRFGAGRWSEIKKLAFASYSYRTSVDLKDKWRNLLKASLSQASTEKGVGSSRKHTSSMPIPAPILVRVRELAEMHMQVGSDQSFSKFASRTRTLYDTRSGFL